jgi:hypothetical protein
LAESLRDLLERTEHDEAGVVTASFGVASCEEGLDADAWVRRADEALYGAKRSGRSCVVLWMPEAEGIFDEGPGFGGPGFLKRMIYHLVLKGDAAVGHLLSYNRRTGRVSGVPSREEFPSGISQGTV